MGLKTLYSYCISPYVNSSSCECCECERADMEAANLSCIGSPLSFCPSRSSSSRGSSGNKVLCPALKPSSSPSPISSLSCESPPSASSLFSQLGIFSVVGVLAKFACLPALAAEEALESSLSSLSSSSAPEAASTQVSESAGSSAVQSSVENAVQSSVESVKAAAAADAGESSVIINILGTAAFIGLSLLTIGIVYLAVSDFLEKRKRDEETKKLNEEEAKANKKRSGSLTAASRGGAKGFGKKREVEE